MAEEKEKAPVAPKLPAGKTVDIIPSSQVVGEGENRKIVPKIVKVSSEADMTPELIFKGPERNKGVNSYVTVDGKKLRFDGKTGLLLSLLLAALLAVFGLAPSAHAQYGVGRTGLKIAATQAPYVTLSGVSATYGPATLLTVNYTAGHVYLGSGPVAVTAGRVTSLTASKTSCDYPTYSSCDIIYADSSGTVAFTTAIGTARATGNSILAFVQTSSTAVTTIQYPWQDTHSDIPTNESSAGEIRAFCTGTLGSAETEYLNDAACASATAATSQRIISTAGTLKTLRVKLRTAVKNTNPVTATVVINGTPSAITCNVAANASTCADTTHTAAVAAGDNVDFSFGATNTSDTGANVGMSVQKY